MADDLHQLVRQLRAELEWAARVGVIDTAPPESETKPLVRPNVERSISVRPGAESVRPGAERPRERSVPERAPSRSVPDPSPPPWLDEERLEAAPPRAAPREAPRPMAAPAAPIARRDTAPRAPRLDEAPKAVPVAAPPVTAPVVVRSTLEAIRAELGECTRCKLSKGRTNIVFGVGSPTAELMFVGEAPGEQEDRLGEPFVGEAGHLLTKMIKAMGFDRWQVYIANVVKCRPPQNRDPEAEEIAACEPFLLKQIESVRPKVIVALGKHATQTLLRTDASITRLRGRWTVYRGVPLMPTYHPAYLLRNPADKRLVWEDLKAVLTALGRTVPERSEK